MRSRHHGRKSALFNTLKEQLVEIEAAAEELVHKVEEKDRRLAFIESIMNDLQTQAEGLGARVKTDSRFQGPGRVEDRAPGD